MIKISTSLEEHILKPTIFPDKTSQVWKLPEFVMKSKYVTVWWTFESEAEFMHLAQLKRLLDHGGVEAWLNMVFLPYARQDKQVLNDQCGALWVFGELINMLGFLKVRALDPHSPIAKKAIKNFEAQEPDHLLLHVTTFTSPDFICYPDTGALERYGRYFTRGRPLVIHKTREQSTGHITKMELYQGRATDLDEIKGNSVLIVDDICDGGMTFIMACELLKKKHGAGQVFLYTTHGIYSKGIKPLQEAGIDRIFCREGEATRYRARWGVDASDYTLTPFHELERKENQ